MWRAFRCRNQPMWSVLLLCAREHRTNCEQTTTHKIKNKTKKQFTNTHEKATTDQWRVLDLRGFGDGNALCMR